MLQFTYAYLYKYICIWLGESFWLSLGLIKVLVTINRNMFPSVAYANASIPSYLSGANGFIICSLDEVSLFLTYIDHKSSFFVQSDPSQLFPQKYPTQ